MKKWNIKNKFHIFKDMGLLQRMMLVYLIGGIIPLIVVSIYINVQSRNMMFRTTRETQKEELSAISTSIRESMSVMDNVARLLCINEEIERLATHKYKNATSFYRDYYGMNAISDYLTFYQQDISYINVYLNNPSVASADLKRMENLSYLSGSVMAQSWCRETMALKDEGYWYFGAMPEVRDQTIQISRALRDEKDRVVGVVVVFMQYKRTKKALEDRSVDTAVYYDGFYWLSGNFHSSKYPFMADNIQELTKKKGTKKLVYGVKEYLLAYEKIFPQEGKGHYALISIQNYQDIMEAVNKISMRAFIPETAGMLLSIILILSFGISYGNRMGKLRQQMHHVAQGEYDQVEQVEGNDEIGELYRELERMMDDIQLLMNHVVDEQVQKEKLHTKQREVEFKMLASQINPHFLYNTLETIRMKALVNRQPEIVELVMMLAKTMRYNIQVAEQLVSLQEELQMVEYYLKIQKYRFGDRITFGLEIGQDVDLMAEVLPLIIQPFVENAFVHGLEEKESGGRLDIIVRMQGGNICIIIRDNGVGMDYYELGALRKSLREEDVDRNHIGVHNVNQRIKLLYGEEFGVQIDSHKGIGTSVTIQIPC